MKDAFIGREEFAETKCAQLPYHAPELTNLGPIQEIVQGGAGFGGDAGPHSTSMS